MGALIHVQMGRHPQNTCILGWKRELLRLRLRNFQEHNEENRAKLHNGCNISAPLSLCSAIEAETTRCWFWVDIVNGYVQRGIFTDRQCDPVVSGDVMT